MKNWSKGCLMVSVAFGDIEADCPKEYWFDGSVDIQLAANALERPIACYTSGLWAKYHPPSLTLPHSVPSGKRYSLLPFVMHFVNGNHWEPVLLRSSVKMQWPPLSQRHKQQWNEINPGHDHKTFWRYLHIKKTVDQDSTASSLEKRRQASPILILDESDCDIDMGGDHHGTYNLPLCIFVF
ncbi:hypothetical protein BDB00DRAFT_915131 [Zychaea mexicana]|uniref:uncharacterized protein n=1 Tax=Zychaea mexicana TaxID=64656 RepID=UPI0022FDB7A3|nr:uncharacterized protein BDB00DRAFT_915131 [Zychaea mexicana]KAI9490852.1 hypothetical protein BDB00DRAFT_915131 [Zychaea mexicana]